MRHWGPILALAIELLTATMCPPPCFRCLVALSSGIDLYHSAAFPACFAAIALPAITTGADGEYLPTVWLTAVAWAQAFHVVVRCLRRHFIQNTPKSK